MEDRLLFRGKKMRAEREEQAKLIEEFARINARPAITSATPSGVVTPAEVANRLYQDHKKRVARSGNGSNNSSFCRHSSCLRQVVQHRYKRVGGRGAQSGVYQ